MITDGKHSHATHTVAHPRTGPIIARPDTLRGISPAPAWICALLWAFVLLLTTGYSTAVARTLIPAHELSFGQADTAAFVDVFGDGSKDLLLAGPDGVALFAMPGKGDVGGEEHWPELLRLPPLPAPATTATAADVTGDGVPELIIGTGQAGAVYVLRRTGTGWTMLAQTPYVWSPVTSLLAADLSGDGKAEIVALTEDGDAHVFAWERSRIQNVRRLPTHSKAIVHIAIADVVGDGSTQLVTTETNGRVSVWTWPLTEPKAETFVWGLPASLSVLSGKPDSIVVTTYERMLYNFHGGETGLVAAGSPLNDPRLPFTFAEAVRLPGDANDYVIALNTDGLGLWRVNGTNIAFIDEGWAEDPLWAKAVPGADTFIVGEAGRAVSMWERKPSGYFHFSVDSVQIPLNDPPLFRQSQVMLSARDWANALGMQLYWEADEQRLTLTRNGDYAIATMDEWEIIVPKGRRSVSIAPVNEGGRTYMPPELPAWFGLDYRWNPRIRTLDVRTRPSQSVTPEEPSPPAAPQQQTPYGLPDALRFLPL